MNRRWFVLHIQSGFETLEIGFESVDRLRKSGFAAGLTSKKPRIIEEEG